MKKTLVLTLCLGMVSVASAATLETQTPSPAVISPPTVQNPNTFSVYYDHTTFDSDLDGDVIQDGKYPGIRIAYDRILGQWERGYWSLHASFSCGGVSGDNSDETLYGAIIGADGNFKLSERVSVFAGPRLGFSKFEMELKKDVYEKNGMLWGEKGEKTSESFFIYGAEAGIRYQVSDRWNIQASFRYMQYQEKDECKPSATSFSLGAGWSF